MRKDEALLRKQFAPHLAADSSESRQALADAAAKAEAVALTDMRQALAGRAGFALDESEATARAVSELRLDSPDVVVTKDLAQQLQAVSGADDLLRFRITDYGATPKAWRNGYIAFEVTSTLAIAAIAYSYPATRAIAGVYLVEEGIEETVEGYAGFWAIDEVARPVRLEAQLVSLDSGTEQWKEAVTGFSDLRPTRLLRKVGGAEQDAQRARATHDAVSKLAAKVN